MFQRFHELRERREGGFTLIELLVVILIIAILAAVAIPIFLRQRVKGWEDQARATLRDAATAQESHRTEDGVTGYTTTVSGGAGATDDLTDQGFRVPSYGTLTVDSADANAYCMNFAHNSLGTAADVDFYFDSDEGNPRPGACT